MLEIKKGYNDYCYKMYTIKTQEGSFKMYIDENLSLYLSPNTDMNEIADEYYYTITNENEMLYNVFNELYDSIVSNKPYKYMDDCVLNEYEYENTLFDNGEIKWHSDDFSYESASILGIRKDEHENFVVSFNKSKLVCDDISPFITLAVRISNGFSRYYPYNSTFMDMYNKLDDCCNKREESFKKEPWYKKVKIRVK